MPLKFRVLITAIVLACAGLLFTSVWAQMADGPGANKQVASGPRPKFSDDVRAIFFTDARSKLGPGALPDEYVPPPKGGSGGPRPTQPLAGTNNPGGTTAAGNWSELIDAAELENAVKAAVPTLMASVKTPGSFKSREYRVARQQFSLLAVIFGVIAQYDGDVRWKEEAGSMRDNLAKAGFNCKVGSDGSFREAKLQAQILEELVRGSKVDFDADAQAKVPWPNVADLSELMKRMEFAQRKVLKPMTGSEADFKENMETILHEGMILAMLGEVIKDAGYLDDESYAGYAEEMKSQCLDVISGVKQNQFPRIQQAVGQINQACDSCHSDFR